MRVVLHCKLRVLDPQLVVISPDDAAQLASKPPRTRIRNGGKDAADKLLKPVKATGKRAAFLRWFLEEPTGRTVGLCMAYFQMTRPNVIAYWTAIHRDHGIGYALSANVITANLPPGCGPSNIFRGETS